MIYLTVYSASLLFCDLFFGGVFITFTLAYCFIDEVLLGFMLFYGDCCFYFFVGLLSSCFLGLFKLLISQSGIKTYKIPYLMAFILVMRPSYA